jgi:hypothetical protein
MGSGFAMQRPIGTGRKYTLSTTYLYQQNTMTAGSVYTAAINFWSATWPSILQNFLAQWDMYRVRRARVRWIPQFNVSTSGVASTDEQLPNITYVANYDDIGTPAGFTSVLVQPGARVLRFNREVRSAWIIPATLVNNSQSGGNGNGVVLFMPWLNTSGSATLLTGAKYAIEAVPYLPGNGRFDVFIDIQVEFSQLNF